jgi:hypothetical protein
MIFLFLSIWGLLNDSSFKKPREHVFGAMTPPKCRKKRSQATYLAAERANVSPRGNVPWGLHRPRTSWSAGLGSEAMVTTPGTQTCWSIVFKCIWPVLIIQILVWRNEKSVYVNWCIYVVYIYNYMRYVYALGEGLSNLCPSISGDNLSGGSPQRRVAKMASLSAETRQKRCNLRMKGTQNWWCKTSVPVWVEDVSLKRF